MCGIVGKATLSDPVGQQLIERMCAVIEHRGPDSRGVFVAGGVGLGVQRLRVIDLETGDQPIFNEDGSVVVVLNGEIYNYKELVSDLERRGHAVSTQSDTEVIVHLYEDYGVDCVQHLRGMFAFALWDSRRRQLLLARDRVGKKPLFYSFRDGTLWFASEAKSILQDSAIPREADLDAIDSFMRLQYVPHPLSAFRALRKLPPAHTLVWRDGAIELSRYWRLSYRRGPITSEAEAHEAIRSELLEATRLRLRSDVALGAFLSGGVDSSAVVAAMAREGGRVKTFSIGFDVESYDETPYAREVAQLYDTDHAELRVDPEAMKALPRLVWHYGEPFADSSALPSFYLSEITRRHVTVALNGDGGDESFAGYPRHIGSAFTNQVAKLPRPIGAGLASLASVLGEDRGGNDFRSRLSRITHRALITPEERYASWFAVFDSRERALLYTPEFSTALGEIFARNMFAAVYRESDAQDDVNRLLDIDVHTYLTSDLLVKMDIASMAHSLEVRSPLLDHRFMEMAAGLPGSWKLRGRATKKVFKDALRPWLPSHLLDREKQGFGVPLAAWFRGRLKELPAEILLDPRALARGYFREHRLRQIIEEHLSGVRNRQDQIWTLIQLELWFRTFVDGGVNGPLTLNAG
jgi:asparagine synthase (glutamine-hydrolysing)